MIDPFQHRAAAGFTLVESMVSLLVVSVGLIGIAALHGQSLSASRTAIYRSQAVHLASDMADRIRTNRTAELAYEGPGADRGCTGEADGGTACTPAEIAAHDLFAWRALVADALPGGQGAVDVDTSSPPAQYRVSVDWDDPAADAPVQVDLVFNLSAH